MTYEDIARLRKAVFSSPGATDRATRLAAGSGGPLPEPLGSYARMVRDESYRVSDAEVARLRADGHREDELFEITVAAAVGAALHSFDAGIAVVFSTTKERS